MDTDNGTRHGHTVLGRVALAVLVLIGAFMVVIPLATGLPGKSSDTGDMMTAFRPQMSDSSLAQAAADQQTMAAMGQQLQAQMLPALAQLMKMTPDQLNAYMATTYPNVGKGMAEFQPMMAFFGDLQTTMRAQQANYQQADQIPTSFMPPTTMTPLFIIPGAILMLIGGFGLLRQREVRRTLYAAGAVGVIVVVSLFAVNMYGKASSADEMTKAYKPVFATTSVQQARAYTDTAKAMSAEFIGKALPGMATALKLSPAQLSAMLTQQFPAVATGVSQMPAIVGRMDTATSLIENNVRNYEQSASIPWSPGSMVTMFWFMMGPAALAVLVAVGGLLLAGGRREVPLAAAPRARPGALHG